MSGERCCMESRVLWCRGKDAGLRELWTKRFKQITGGLVKWSGCNTKILLEGDEQTAEPLAESGRM